MIVALPFARQSRHRISRYASVSGRSPTAQPYWFGPRLDHRRQPQHFTCNHVPARAASRPVLWMVMGGMPQRSTGTEREQPARCLHGYRRMFPFSAAYRRTNGTLQVWWKVAETQGFRGAGEGIRTLDPDLGKGDLTTTYRFDNSHR